MKISIVIPSFNQGCFIEDTIKSILDQEYSDVEIIVIDGGSTDNSVDIIKKYEKHLSYWISEKDLGQSHAIIKGLKIAKGEIFAWQNSDDKYLPGTFNFISDVFKNNSKIDLVFGGWNFIDSDGKFISLRNLNNYSLKKLRAGFLVPPQPSVFFRNAAINKAGGPNIEKRQVMDYELYIKIATENNVFVTPKILGEFRIHKMSKTISAKKEQVRELKETRNCILSNCSISDKIFWQLSDIIEAAKDFTHSKFGVFSLRDLLK